MAKFILKGATISGMSITLGENKRNIDDEPLYYNNDTSFLKRLKRTVGFGTRYEANKNTTTCDLCYDAAKRLMNEMNISSVDAVIFVTQTPDYHMPGNAHIIHQKLNLKKTTFALDIELGCSGFIYGLLISYMFACNSLDRILLLTGDTFSKVANKKDRTEYPLFCDAGSATLIEKDASGSASYFILQSDGTGVSKMFQPAGAYKHPSNDETRKEKEDEHGNIRSDENIYMNGFDIFNFTLTEQPALLNEILNYSNKSISDIDYFVFHQANKYIVETLAKSAEIPANKFPVIFPDYGNQNSASIPGTICATLSNLLEGRKQLLLQGFGIGLSWGGCQLELNSPTILKPVIYSGVHGD